MTARHKKRNQTPPVTPSTAPTTLVETKRHELRQEAWLGLKLSIIIFFVLAGVKWKVEQTHFGKLIEQMTYDLLQLQLSSTPSTTQKAPVIVLDISDIPMVPSKSLQSGLITKREPLRKIVDFLAGKQGTDKPQAIGVDVDFSPDPSGYADPEDQSVLDSFLKDSEKTPVRVGVHNSLALGPEKWLRDPKYISLATCVVVPNPDEGQSTRYMVEWLNVSYSKPPYEGITEHCPSLGVALVKATIPGVPWWLSPFAESTNWITSKGPGSLTGPRFLVDYGQLEGLTSSAKEAYNPVTDGPIDVDVGGKIVLLGRTRNTTDNFTIPGRPEKPYPGVFLHASAAYTLSGSSLNQLTGPGRAVFDVLIPVGIFLAVFWIRLNRAKRTEDDLAEDGFPELLSFLVTLVLVAAAIIFVRVYHLMWDNFILVAVVLIVHPPLERAAGQIHRWLAAEGHSRRHGSPPVPQARAEDES